MNSEIKFGKPAPTLKMASEDATLKDFRGMHQHLYYRDSSDIYHLTSLAQHIRREKLSKESNSGIR